MKFVIVAFIFTQKLKVKQVKLEEEMPEFPEYFLSLSRRERGERLRGRVTLSRYMRLNKDG